MAVDPTTIPPPERTAENAIIHNVALGVTPIALGAMFLPPRRFDLRLIILGGVALWGTNQLVYDYTGTSSLNRFGTKLGSTMGSMAGTELPEKAQRTQMLLRQERERRAAAAADQARVEAQKDGKEGGKNSSLEAIWMGDAGDDWKEKRAQREREALSEGGGGIWGLIMDHISDVRSSGKQKRAEVVASRAEREKQLDAEKEEEEKRKK